MRTPDTVIIGGGLMGCGVAWRLAQAGQRVHVIEKAVPGAEASSAAAGILGPQAECDAPGPMLELGLRSRAMYRAFVDELQTLTGLDVGYRVSGLVHAAWTGAGAERLRERVAWQHEAGLKVELVDAKGAKLLEPALADGVVAALHMPDEALVDPRPLSKAVSQAAAKAGAVLQPASVKSVRLEGGRAVGVELVDGTRIDAGAVVVAAGAWSGLVPNAGDWAKAVVPARGQLVQLHVAPTLLSRVLFTERGYLVPRTDGRLLAGSTLEFVGFEKQVTAAGMKSVLDLALAAVPALAQAPILESWAGFRPYTADGMPLLGKSPIDGLFFATGHHRNGILLAPVTARLVADAVLRRELDLDLRPFRPERAQPA
ncbi:MAG: glycine oxidase ThiO [Deltaproteobacteria bacterium]|nr:glycine oxidase ThiO [Deltaproteobacteria bacterium]